MKKLLFALCVLTTTTWAQSTLPVSTTIKAPQNDGTVNVYVKKTTGVMMQRGKTGAEIPIITDAITRSIVQFGAVGNGVADDTAPIQAARAWLATSTLSSPKRLDWKYPCAYKSTAGLAAVQLTDVSGVTIDMTGGRLVMDNLDNSGLGTTAGIAFFGTGQGYLLINPHVEWKTRPSARSQGFGICFKGKPTDSECLKDIRIQGTAYVKNAPQGGTFFSGCKNIRVDDNLAVKTYADGLHFNACQNIDVGAARGDTCGDDVMAFVTYYDPSDLGGAESGNSWKTSFAPWNQPSLGVWSNFNATVAMVSSRQSGADACRIAGSNMVTITTIHSFQDNSGGLVLDAGEIGGGFSFAYQASRNVKVETVNAWGGAAGVIARSFNATLSDANFVQFDVNIGTINVRNSTGYGGYIGTVNGLKVGAFYAYNSANTDLLIDNSINVDIGRLVSNKLGSANSSSLFITNNCTNISLPNVDITGGKVYIASTSGSSDLIQFGSLTIKNSPTYALNALDVSRLRINNLYVYNCNTGNSSANIDKWAVFLSRIYTSSITNYEYHALTTNYQTLVVGGGTSGHIAANDLTISQIKAIVPGSAHGVFIDTGTNGAINYRYNLLWQDSTTGTWTPEEPVNAY